MLFGLSGQHPKEVQSIFISEGIAWQVCFNPSQHISWLERLDGNVTMRVVKGFLLKTVG